jgi:O-antigen ligase
LAVIQDQPLGRGLGTAGTIGQRFVGNLAITNENWYLQLGTEMGVLAAVLYLLIVGVVALLCLKSYFEVRDFWLKSLALGVGAGAIGFLILGNFLHAWENTVLSMVFWLLAGVVVRARDLEDSPAYAEAPEPALEGGPA